MKITKSQLRRIIKEELEKLHDQARETAAKSYRLRENSEDVELIIKAAQEATGDRYPITSEEAFVQAVDMAHRDGSFGTMLPNPNEIQAAWYEFVRKNLHR